MCSTGMSPMESLVATTQVAAQCLGWDDRLGTLEAGKLADVVITSIDPLADIRGLERPENIRLVLQDGRIVKNLQEPGKQ
jgi:imidazolonepropionase-like amidohydrolase